MSTKFQKLLNKFRKLNLPEGQYAIYGSGPMAVRGIREAKDLDVVVKNDLYEKLLMKYKESESGKMKIGDIDVIPAKNSLIDDVDEVINSSETIEGIKFVRLEDLIKWKEKMGRSKDFEDIKLIENYLNKT